MSPNKEIDRLAKYLMEIFPNDIGEGDHAHGGSAVDVAIRLLDKYKIIKDNIRRYQVYERKT